jgi:hypothetical protein
MPVDTLTTDRIKAEAQRAAQEYDCVNDACNYSFYTEAGRIFKAEFQKARMAINKQTLQGTKAGAA